MTEEEVENVIGIDIEPEDRDVGIFGNSILLGLRIENNKELWLVFDDEKWADLLSKIKEVKAKGGYKYEI